MASPPHAVVGILVDSETDVSTGNGKARVFIVIKSGAYQQDRYQLRLLINMFDSWEARARYEML